MLYEVITSEMGTDQPCHFLCDHADRKCVRKARIVRKGGLNMSIFCDIKKRLGDFTLQISFDTKEETVALMGASGCGKSMTLRCIAGIQKPDAGKIIINGVTVFDSENKINLPPQKRRVGYMFQDYALFPNMTVEKNIGAVLGKERLDELPGLLEIV